MAFKLSKTDEKRRQELITNLNNKAQDIKEEIREAEGIIEELVGKVNAKIRDYNSIVDEVENYRHDLITVWRGEFDEKSENWQQGDNGSAAEELINEWENLSVDQMDEIEPAELPELEFELSDALEALPEG